jgi:hypothetical protein
MPVLFGFLEIGKMLFAPDYSTGAGNLPLFAG